MRIRRPTPAMGVALTALVFSMTGTGIAAVNYARNAGAVDGKSAVSASTKLSRAEGRLVATARGGSDKGKIPGKFLAGVVRGNAGVSGFGRGLEVTDNATGSPFLLASVRGFGTLTSTCADQREAPGVEDPSSTLTYNNQSGEPVSLSRRVGTGDAAIGVIAPNTIHQFTIAGSNTFVLQVQRGASNLLVHGVVRQDGQGTANATCAVYGTAQRIG